MPVTEGPVVIVGAGVFGLSLAYELTQRGYSDISVLDRFLPPVPDGSSVDISRVIRSEYGDEQYHKMAIEAIQGWKSDYQNFYHESGICLIAQGHSHSYLERAKALSCSQGAALQTFDDGDSIRDAYPYFDGSLANARGYTNPSGGWAESTNAIHALAQKCSQAGVSFFTGAAGTVTSLDVDDRRRVRGVKVRNGTTIPAERVVLATGAWTSHLIDLGSSAIGTLHAVGYTQLTASESSKYAQMPIMLNVGTGFFVFPPIPGSNMLKFARHGYGFETVEFVSGDGGTRPTSCPRRDQRMSLGGFIPEEAEEALRQGLRLLFPPEISERMFAVRRMCWYTDTPDNDWIVDFHGEIEGLFLATGGSGHAFKFLPVLGRYTADVFEDKASREIRQKWAFRPGDPSLVMHGDGSRGGPPRRRLQQWEQAEL